MYEAKYSTNNIGGRCRRNRTVIAPCYNYITGRLPMLRKTFALLAGASLLAAASAAHANSLSQDSGQTVAAKPAATENEKLKALFAQSDEDNLKRNPISALFRGMSVMPISWAIISPMNISLPNAPPQKKSWPRYKALTAANSVRLTRLLMMCSCATRRRRSKACLMSFWP